MSPLRLVCATVLLASASLASVANHSPCEEFPENLCTVTQVRIDPCSNPKSCRLRKGRPASIAFDFTPNFAANKLKTGLFWANENGDVPFPVLQDADACELTTCPVESGKTQELFYNLKISKLLPQGTFVFKWKMWDEENPSQVCCFKTEIQLRK